MLAPPWGENDLDTAGEWLESNIELIEQWLRQRASNNFIKRLHDATIPPYTVTDNTNGVTPQLSVVKVKDNNNHGSPRTRSSLSPEDVKSKPPARKQSQTSTLSFSPESSLEIYREVSNNSKISIFQIPSPDVLDPEGSRRTSTNSNISITHSSPSPPPCETVIENFKFYNSSSRSTSPETISQWDQPHLPVTVQPSSNNILSCDSAAAIAISSRRTSIASCHLVHTSSQSSFTQQQGSTNVGSKGTNAASRRTSITSDLFQIWLGASPVKASASGTLPTVIRDLTHLDESELFMELIRDVANELDLDVLCHKILVNICILTHADRGSLFLARGPAENRFLVAKLFDVTRDTELDDAVHKARTEELRIPFGVGIAGTVAQTKEIINIKNAYEDPRFNSDVDTRTGYKTNLILCMPICNYEGDVIGVAQIINKTNESEEFTDHDVEIFQRYLTFCGIGIQNAQLFEVSVLEYRRNQILLNLARSIFEEQNNLECLVTKIMTEAQELLKCERCAVFLLDLDCCEANHLERIIERPTGGRALPEQHKPLSRRESGSVTADDMRSLRGSGRSVFTTVFELREAGPEAVVTRPTVADLQNSTLAQIASYVANTGQILNIGDVKSWLKTSVAVDAETVSARTILCMPIVNAQKHVIGVAQLINKASGQLFTDCDVSLFEAFAIFCGLGIHNTQMYESACKLMAKQKVALECLSYHATASNDATMQLTRETIPSAETYNLYSFTFIDFDLSDDDTCRATVRMFLQCNLVQQFHIPYDVLCRWILSVRKNYRPVKYHNWRHALNVAQTMFAMLKTGKMERFMTDLEILGLLVACLCHDLDHRGTNNAFQTKTESPLAILYTTSTMEHHHFDQCVMILNTDCNNIFQALSPDDYKKVMKTVETAILSTDLAMYFKKKSKFLELIDNGEFDWQSEDKKELLCGMMMTACDVSAIAKPWEVQHRVAKLVADEFFDQGDLERLQLKQEPVAMMDRERKDELPQMQVGFIDVICLPLYKVLSETFPWMEPLYKGTMENRKNWQDLAEKVEMGLTWIDHDTIDKPIETLAEAEAVKELEFTVTTLHQQNTAINSNDATVKSTAVATLISNQRNRMQSIKTKSLTRVVRARLTKSLYGASSLAGTVQQPSSSTVYSNIVGENSSPSAHIATVPPTPNVAPSTPKSKPKNRSKLCSIL